MDKIAMFIRMKETDFQRKRPSAVTAVLPV